MLIHSKSLILKNLKNEQGRTSSPFRKGTRTALCRSLTQVPNDRRFLRSRSHPWTTHRIIWQGAGLYHRETDVFRKWKTQGNSYWTFKVTADVNKGIWPFPIILGICMERSRNPGSKQSPNLRTTCKLISTCVIYLTLKKSSCSLKAYFSKYLRSEKHGNRPNSPPTTTSAEIKWSPTTNKRKTSKTDMPIA